MVGAGAAAASSSRALRWLLASTSASSCVTRACIATTWGGRERGCGRGLGFGFGFEPLGLGNPSGTHGTVHRALPVGMRVARGCSGVQCSAPHLLREASGLGDHRLLSLSLATQLRLSGRWLRPQNRRPWPGPMAAP